MAFVRSLIFAILFFLGTVIAVMLAVPAAWLGQRAVHRVGRCWAIYHNWCAAILLGIHVRVEGAIPIGPALVAAKHESMFETLEMIRLLDGPAVVVKQELASIPGWGWVALKHGVIPVDRAGSAAAMRVMIRRARAAIEDDRGIVIFPEGTRVLPGERAPLKAGFAGLYRQLKLPVVPVAIDSGRLYPRRGFIKRPGVITVRFGAAIPAGLSREAAEAAVLDGINVLNDRAAAPKAGGIR